GDFISYLMELLYPIINRPAHKLKLYTLSQTLENSIRKTSAQYDSADILSRIDIFLDRNSKHEKAWNIFALKYRIDGPISTIFNEPSQLIYLNFFDVFWKIKRIEFLLNNCWINSKIIIKQYMHSKFRPIFNKFNFIL